jgi:hypothetical protein
MKSSARKGQSQLVLEVLAVLAEVLSLLQA